MAEYLVEAEAVSKSFDGVPALTDGRLHLRAGEVHALCGGNGAGKSTFLNILMGLLQRDGGTIKIGGAEVDFRTPAEAMAKSVAIITQELSPIRDLTVAENIYLGREPKRGCLVDHACMRDHARALLADLRFDVPANAKMSTLSLAKVQLVEIARALSQNARILIMDEPTSAIGQRETHVLFDAIRKLAESGVGIIYVSHRLDEIFEIATTYTVFRNGRFVEGGAIRDIDRARLVHQIVGYEITAKEPTRKSEADQIVLEADRIGHEPEFRDISLSIRRGEIVGLYGLMGAGRSELLNAVFGIGPRSSGVVRLKGKALPPERPDMSIANGMTMVTEDRKDTGLVLQASIRNNISLSVLGMLSKWGVLQPAAEKNLSTCLMRKLAIRSASDKQRVGALSGGNQQKVVIARCMSSRPDVLICDEPTRGIDEGAKQEIYRLLVEFVASGGAVLVCSSEAPEILQLCSRVLIIKKGELVAELPIEGLTQKSLLHRAS